MSDFLAYLASLPSLLVSAIAFGTVIMFGSVGETITEKSGHLNLGVPGIMYLGGIASLASSFIYEQNVPAENRSVIIAIILPIAAGFIAAALGGLIYAFLTITLRANQNVTGLTLTIFGSGVANFFGASLTRLSGGVGQVKVKYTSDIFRSYINLQSENSFVSTLYDIFIKNGWLVYIAIIVAVVCQIFLTKTRTGLNLRAVGENPATADAAGINVTRYKYLATCIGAGICGLGGTYYVLDYTKGTWANDGTIENLGWLAVALVIFSIWKPKNSIWGAYLFAALFWLWLYVPGLTRSSQELFKMLPYVVTIVVLIIISLKKKRENQPPAGLGLAYFREDR